jgi:hypothetical protein
MRERKRLEIIAENLEVNDFFNNEIKRMNQKDTLNINDLFKLREDLGKRSSNFANLSDFWDYLLTDKIRNPQLKMSELLSQFQTKGAPVNKIENPITGEVHYAIEVFPNETTKDDVLYSLSRLRERYGKQISVQPSYNRPQDLEIEKQKSRGKSYQEIRKESKKKIIFSDEDMARKKFRVKQKKKQ